MKGAAAALALALAVLAGLALNVTAWARDVMLDTPEFVATVDTVRSEPAVVAAATRFLDDYAFTDGRAARIADDLAARLPLTAAERDQVTRRALAALRRELPVATAAVLTTTRFDAAWRDILTLAHRDLVAELRRTAPDDGRQGVQLDLGEVVRVARSRLEGRLGELGPLVDQVAAGIGSPRVTIVSRERLATARRVTSALDELSVVLPIALAVLVAAGLVLARRRLRAAAWTAAGLAAGALATIGVSRLVRADLTGRVDGGVNRQAADAVAAEVLRGLERQSLVVTLIATAVAVALGLLARRQGPW